MTNTNPDPTATIPFTLFQPAIIDSQEIVHTGDHHYTIVIMKTLAPLEGIRHHYQGQFTTATTLYEWVPDLHIESQHHSAYRLNPDTYVVLEYRRERASDESFVVHFIMPPPVYAATFSHYAEHAEPDS